MSENAEMEICLLHSEIATLEAKNEELEEKNQELEVIASELESSNQKLQIIVDKHNSQSHRLISQVADLSTKLSNLSRKVGAAIIKDNDKRTCFLLVFLHTKYFWVF